MRSPAGLGLEPALYLAEDRSGGNRNLLFSGVIRSQEGDQGGSENKGCGGWAAYASHEMCIRDRFYSARWSRVWMILKVLLS